MRPASKGEGVAAAGVQVGKEMLAGKLVAQAVPAAVEDASAEAARGVMVVAAPNIPRRARRP